MESILFLAHTESNGTLPAAALEALGCATSLATSLGGVELTVGLVGADTQGCGRPDRRMWRGQVPRRFRGELRLVPVRYGRRSSGSPLPRRERHRGGRPGHIALVKNAGGRRASP